MQTAIDISATVAQTVSKLGAEREVNVYLNHVLGVDYDSTNGVYEHDRWQFMIRCRREGINQPCVVGRVMVNAQTGAVIPLTADQIREIRECAEWEVARVRGELARDADGYASRHQARRLARRWLDQHLTMKFGAGGGILIPLHPPVWQFSIYFDLFDLHLEPLGVIDVDALTGEVQSLEIEHLENLREQVRAVIQHQEPAAAA